MSADDAHIFTETDIQQMKQNALEMQETIVMMMNDEESCQVEEALISRLAEDIKMSLHRDIAKDAAVDDMKDRVVSANKQAASATAAATAIAAKCKISVADGDDTAALCSADARKYAIGAEEEMRRVQSNIDALLERLAQVETEVDVAAASVKSSSDAVEALTGEDQALSARLSALEASRAMAATERSKCNAEFEEMRTRHNLELRRLAMQMSSSHRV